jgi:hypothetical protein
MLISCLYELIFTRSTFHNILFNATTNTLISSSLQGYKIKQYFHFLMIIVALNLK